MTKTSINMPLERNSALEDKANSYRQMIELWAFKDLMMVLEGMKTEAHEKIMETSVKDLSEASFGHIKGIVETIDRIKKHLEYTVNP